LDILLVGGTILTSEQGREQGITVRKNTNISIENGLITTIGPERMPSPEMKIDCNKKVLIPALVNSHAHCAMTLLRGVSDNCQLQPWLEVIWNYEKHLKAVHCRIGIELACLEMIKNGIGMFVDNYFYQNDVFDTVAESGLRAQLGSGIIEVESLIEKIGGITKQINDAEKLIRKGSKHPRVKGALSPHSTWTCSKETLEKAAVVASRYKALMSVHVSETREEVFNLQKKTNFSPVEYLNELGILNQVDKLMLAHCVWITGREVRLLGEKNVSVAFCPASGQKLAYGGVAPIPELEKAGANICLGTDGPASNNTQDIIREMRAGTLLLGHDRWNPSVYNAKQIFSAATRNLPIKLDSNTGMIVTGMKADIATVNFKQPHLSPVHDYLSNIVYSANGSDVSDLIVDGNPLMIGRQVLTLDENIIMKKAFKAVEDIKS